jgi:hypothetical protein
MAMSFIQEQLCPSKGCKYWQGSVRKQSRVLCDARWSQHACSRGRGDGAATSQVIIHRFAGSKRRRRHATYSGGHAWTAEGTPDDDRRITWVVRCPQQSQPLIHAACIFLPHSGVPIPGVVIHITTVASLNEGSGKNFQSAFGNAAYRWGGWVGMLTVRMWTLWRPLHPHKEVSGMPAGMVQAGLAQHLQCASAACCDYLHCSRSDGVCILKLLAGRAYVITATCEGFHKWVCVQTGSGCLSSVDETHILVPHSPVD